MSYQEKGNYISLITNVLIGFPYLFFVLTKYSLENPTGSDELAFWANALIVLIPIRIVTEIVLHIIMAILTAIITQKEEFDDTTDERDNLIELKSTRNSAYLFYFGFALAILSLAIFKTASSFFIITMAIGATSEFFGIISKIFYYRKGV